MTMGHRVRGLLVLAAILGLGLTTAGCADAAAARGSCRAQGVGELRCRAIVADAARRVRPDTPPMIGVDVRMATPADRTTLRGQTLLAVVRFAFLDGSSQEVEVFCGGWRGDRAVCVETQS